MTPFSFPEWASFESNVHVVYQPIVSWSRREISGYEVLLRSTHGPDRRPDQLLACARQRRAMVRLGRTIRALVASTFDRMPENTPVFVNVDGDELRARSLLADDEPFAPYASRVVLEITEAGARFEPGELSDCLRPLRARGYQFALDDLGAGHNGLATFAEVDVDVVKFDMSLVRDVHRSAIKQRVIGFLSELCAERGVLSVAEGVESFEERDTLVRLGCDLFQGHYFGRPSAPFSSDEPRGFSLPRRRAPRDTAPTLV